MNKFDFRKASYCVGGLQGFSLSDAMKLWKAKFETIEHFVREVIAHPSLDELHGFISEMWESIVPITVTEALSEKNIERRRVMFDCIGVIKLFASLEPKLIDRQVIHKKRRRWDESNLPYDHSYEDVYELYLIEAEKLFGGTDDLRNIDPVFAVRCWCTTTAREYWIYVPQFAALGVTRWNRELGVPDVIRAIAWTIRIDITNPVRIYRQGDIIIAEESENSRETSPYHITKEMYLELMYSET